MHARARCVRAVRRAVYTGEDLLWYQLSAGTAWNLIGMREVWSGALGPNWVN